MPRKLASHVKWGTVSDKMRNEKVTIRLDKVAATDSLGESNFVEVESEVVLLWVQESVSTGKRRRWGSTVLCGEFCCD